MRHQDLNLVDAGKRYKRVAYVDLPTFKLTDGGGLGPFERDYAIVLPTSVSKVSQEDGLILCFANLNVQTPLS